MQPHIFVCMLNIATCRTCPEAELAPVSPTADRLLRGGQCIWSPVWIFLEGITAFWRRIHMYVLLFMTWLAVLAQSILSYLPYWICKIQDFFIYTCYEPFCFHLPNALPRQKHLFSATVQTAGTLWLDNVFCSGFVLTVLTWERFWNSFFSWRLKMC